MHFYLSAIFIMHEMLQETHDVNAAVKNIQCMFTEKQWKNSEDERRKQQPNRLNRHKTSQTSLHGQQ